MDYNIPYHLYERAFRTGSSVICSPPVTNTDIDVMFYTRDMAEFTYYLHKNGWKMGGSINVNSDWVSYKKDNLNYLLTNNEEYFDKFYEATKIATKLNLHDKAQRITLFRYIVEGETD